MKTEINIPEGPYQVVCDAGSEEWLAHRHKLLTASDMATLLGMNPWEKNGREKIIREKVTGQATFTGNDKSWWGQWLEVPNMMAFSDICGMAVQPTNTLLRACAPSARHLPIGQGEMGTDWLPVGCTLDGYCLPPKPLGQLEPHLARTPALESFVRTACLLEGPGVIEMKNSDYNPKKRGEPSMWELGPDPEVAKEGSSILMHWVQVQVQLLVTGLSWGVLVGKIGGHKLFAHVVLPNHKFFDTVVEESLRAWKEIENGRSKMAGGLSETIGDHCEGAIQVQDVSGTR